MKIIRNLIVIIIIALNAYASFENHKAFVYSLKQKIDDILIRGNEKSHHEKLQEIIQDSIDLKKVSQFVMGKHWILSTEKTKEDFVREYTTYFTRLCIKILNNYVGSSKMTIMSVKKVTDGVYIISTRFSYDENEGFNNIDFKIIECNNSFLIDDIVMSGMSITINQRTQFNEKIDTYGIASVIEELKCSNNS